MLGCLAVAQAYDAATDFDLVNNPSGVWSYGYSPNFSSISLFTTQFALAPAVEGWRRTSPSEPWIAKNTTASLVTFGTASIKAGQLTLHPSNDGSRSLIRFTAPTAGLYSFSAAFEQRNTLASSVDVHVVHNSSPIWSGLSSTFNVPVSTSGTVTLAAGDTLTVAVGPDGSYVNDWTGVAFGVTAVPEPATMAALGAGLFGLIARRKRSLR